MQFTAFLPALVSLGKTHCDPAMTSDDCVAFDQWWLRLQTHWQSHPDSGARALLAGVMADRLGFAFAGGYSAALQRLLNDATLPASALCVTEVGGNQPRHLACTLADHGNDWRLNGEKTFVTMGDRAQFLLVAASTGETEGRKQIRLVRVPAHLQGISLIPLPTLNFVPEIGHAKVRFDQVRLPAEALLPGDGYADYVKPFRTIEDVHVSAACCGLLLGAALRQDWPADVLNNIMALAYGWFQLASEPATCASTHVTLAGLMHQQKQLIDSVTTHLATVPAFATRWQRDLPLLNVAEKARQQRTANAWNTLLETRQS